MEENKQKQNLAELARKKRYLHLIEKLHSGTPLSKPEIKELEEFEAEPLDHTVVKTMEEVGKIMDVTERTVQRWKREGMPITHEGFYDLDAVKAWHDGRGIIDGEETEGKAYWDEKIRKYKASLLELDLKKATAELVSREEVERGRIARIIAVKRSFLALPTRLAPVLAMREPREIETVLYEAIAEIVDEFAGERNVRTEQNNMDGSGTEVVEASGEDNSQPVG